MALDGREREDDNRARSSEKILIVEDDPTQSALLRYVLQDEGYSVVSVEDGALAVDIALESKPSLVLLDVMLPNVDGYTICRWLRQDRRSKYLPVVMLTARDTIADKVEGLKSGVDAYVAKPFDLEELLLTVKRTIEVSKLRGILSPLTELPGNRAIEETIRERLADKSKPWAILYFDIDNFKALNDRYGFVTGDNVIKFLGNLLMSAVNELGDEDDLAGHVGGDDFVIVTSPEKTEAIANRIITAFDAQIPTFYSYPDRRKGYIVMFDRQGHRRRFKIASLSVVEITSELFESDNYLLLGEVVAELKRKAKKSSGSVLVVNKRHIAA